MKRILQLHFLCLFFNILLVSFIFFTKYQNIAKSNVQADGYQNAVSFVNVFLILSQIMYGILIIFTIFGLPFTKQALSLQILFQLMGVVCFGFFILLRMPYITIGYIWGVFCVIPFIIGLSSLIFKSQHLSKYSSIFEIQEKNKAVKEKQNETA